MLARSKVPFRLETLRGVFFPFFFFQLFLYPLTRHLSLPHFTHECDESHSIIVSYFFLFVYQSGEWTDHDQSLLARAVVKFPGGTPNRWDRIALDIGRSVDEVCKVFQFCCLCYRVCYGELAYGGFYISLSASGSLSKDDGNTTTTPENNDLIG